MKKIKHLKKKIEKLPFYRIGWVLPLVEILLFGSFLLFLSTEPIFLFFGYSGLFIPLSGVSVLLLKFSVINDSILLLILSLLPLILKMVCAIGILNKKRKFTLYCAVLYILDFWGTIVIFITGEIRLHELFASEILRVFLLTFWGAFLAGVFIVSYFEFYKGSLIKEEKKKLRKIICPFMLVVLAIGVTVFTGVYISENKTTATPEEIELVNKCYEYTEKYLQKELPDDKEMLETMQKDIEAVIETDIFKNVVSESKFHERHMNAKADEDYFYYGAIPEKSDYANELMYLKGKILLKLDKNDEYIDYFVGIHKYFTTSYLQKFYCMYLKNDKENYSDEDCEVIKEGCIKLLESDVPEYEKWLCLADYITINTGKLTKEEKAEQRDEIREKYIPGYTGDNFHEDMDKYEVVKRSLYMMQ